MSTVSPKLMTAEELLLLPTGKGQRYELVDGELITMAPAGFEHGDIAGGLHGFLHHFVWTNKLGTVVAAETGFIIRRNPDTVRAPDTAFLSNERIQQYGRPQRGYYPCAPDLVVEVRSPDESQDDVETKTREWFEGGAKLVWVVNPRRKTVVVYQSPADSRELSLGDSLDGGQLLRGFLCPLADIFSSQ